MNTFYKRSLNVPADILDKRLIFSDGTWGMPELMLALAKDWTGSDITLASFGVSPEALKTCVSALYPKSFKIATSEVVAVGNKNRTGRRGEKLLILCQALNVELIFAKIHTKFLIMRKNEKTIAFLSSANFSRGSSREFFVRLDEATEELQEEFERCIKTHLPLSE